jgi:DNA-binding NtrC family response regulator
MARSVTDTPRILVIENDENLHGLIIKVVRKSGCEAVSAYSGEQALAILRDSSQQIDWLLTDIRLGGPVDGWVVGSEFSLTHPLKPIIFMSGAEEDSTSRTAVSSIFLKKPVDVNALLQTFRKLTGEPALA